MYLEIKEEYPPVAIITALSPSSASHCSIKPSIAQAEPLITPDKIASAVLFPIVLMYSYSEPETVNSVQA